MIFLQALRSWRSDRAVASLAALALAIGIGSATAIYTVVEAVMLRPLVYRDADRFVAVFSAERSDPLHYGTLQLSHARTLGERTRAFDAFGWYRGAGQNLTFAGEPHHVEGVAMTASLAAAVGVAPALGQWFSDPHGVTISHALWRRLGADAAIVGKTLSLDGRIFTVAGVMPERFQLPVVGIPSPSFRADVWMLSDPRGVGEPAEGYFVYARRRPEVSSADAQADLERVAAEIAAEDPVLKDSFTVRVFDLRETVVQKVRPTLLLLLAAAALLFLVTCANAAGLLLARSVARARETALRVALGARRLQLASHFFAESLVISLAGAVGGVLLSLLVTPAIVRLAIDYLPRADEIDVNWAVLLFALTAALVAGALASLAPLRQAMRTAPADALGEGVRASATAQSRRLARALVVGEIGLAFGLLVVSLGFVGHVRSLSRTPTGFDPDNLLTFVVSVPNTLARDPDRRLPFQERLVDALEAVPGVEAAGFASSLPLDGCCMSAPVFPEGQPIDPSLSQRTSIMAISPGFIPAMGIALRSGRLLTESDIRPDHAIAMVNEAAVQRYWSGRNPIGSFARFNDPARGRRFEVVGVVGDVRNDGLAASTVPEIYLLSSMFQVETMNFAVRSARPPEALIPEIRRAIRALDPDQPVYDTATMRQIVDRTLTLEQLTSVVTGFFAVAALVMATLAVYSVVSYSVRQRTVEIGTRMAIGATRRDVLALVVGGGLVMAAVGIVGGGLLALAGTSYLASVLPVRGFGPAPFLYSTAIVAAVALVSSSVPGWRAALLPPLVAIRNSAESPWRGVGMKMRTTVRRLTSAETPAPPLGPLIARFAGAVRQSASSRDAVASAVAALQTHLGATAILLLRRDGDEFRGTGLAIPARGFLINRLQSFAHPVAMTDADFAAWREWAEEYRPARLAEIERLGAIGARLTVALRTTEEILGVLVLGPPTSRDRYTGAEKALLGSAADVIALMIENAELADRELEQEKVRRDLALAGEVQRRLLPPHPPRSSHATFAACTIPARTVGGDYYDFLDLDDGRVGIAVADVSGKGIAAALVMSVVQASLRVVSTDRALTPSSIATRMNAFLYQSTGANKYATFFYAEADESRRRLRYVNAGHNPPMLARQTADGVEITELAAGGTVLGLFPGIDYSEATVDLCPGDVLVAFTDGVTEALNVAGEEFGEERVRAFLRETIGAGADDLAARFTTTMRDWIGRAEQHDDLTFVVMACN